MDKNSTKTAINIIDELLRMLSSQRKDFRSKLTEAKVQKVYIVKGYRSFNEFLEDCLTKTNSDISPAYARRQAKAGELEMKLFGKESIGQHKESALRILSENVPDKDRMKVYQQATQKLEDKTQVTAQMIEDAPKELKVYKTRKAPEQPDKELHDTSTVKPKPKVEVKEAKPQSSISEVTPKPKSQDKSSSKTNKRRPTKSQPKVVSIQPKKSDRISDKLISSYEKEDLKKIRSFFRAATNDKIKADCLSILEKHKPQVINNVIKKLTRFLNDNGTASKTSKVG